MEIEERKKTPAQDEADEDDQQVMRRRKIGFV